MVKDKDYYLLKYELEENGYSSVSDIKPEIVSIISNIKDLNANFELTDNILELAKENDELRIALS